MFWHDRKNLEALSSQVRDLQRFVSSDCERIAKLERRLELLATLLRLDEGFEFPKDSRDAHCYRVAGYVARPASIELGDTKAEIIELVAKREVRTTNLKKEKKCQS